MAVRILAAALSIAALAPGLYSQEVSLSEFSWRALGPTAAGGRIVDMDVHPDNPYHLFVASASGGLWESTNNGTTWKCIFENEGTLSIGDILVDPKHPQTIWIGTGEANNQRSAFWGDGVYKTTDSGKTWTNMGLPQSHHIGRIVVDPQDSNTVYVAALGNLYTPNAQRGLYKTTDGGKTWTRSLFISSTVGVCDVVVSPEDPQVVYAASYERLRRAWHFDGAGPGSGIYKSIDGGTSWIRLSGGLPSGEIGRIGLAIAPTNPKIVYSTVSNQNPAPAGPRRPPPAADLRKGVPTRFGFSLQFRDGKAMVQSVASRSEAQRKGIAMGHELVDIGGVTVTSGWSLFAVLARFKVNDLITIRFRADGKQRLVRIRLKPPAERRIGGEVYRSEDGGEHWTKQNRQPIGGSPAYYYGQIRVDPQNEKRIFVLSVPLYRSDDAGRTWKSTARTVHVDHHALWINPKNSRHLLLGNDGGFHISYDGGDTWDYVFNLPLAQFYAISVDMQQPYHVYGGLQDNGSYGGPSRSRNRSGIGRFDWYRVGGGDGFYVQVDSENADTIISESQFGVLNRLNRRTGQRKSIRPPQSDSADLKDRYNWNSPVLMSHHDSRTIYFGGNKLFRSRNQGDDWDVISGDLTTANEERLVGNVPHCTITTIAESPIDKQLLLVGTDDGKVQWTNDGGRQWIDVTDRFPHHPLNWWCTRVELSSHDTNVAYATFSAFREDDFRPFVFVTRDRGETWSSIVGNLPTEPLNVIKEDRVNPQLLYAGSDFGAYTSLDGGRRWQRLGKDLPRVSVHDMLVHPRDKDLVVGTHGRGIFTLNVATLQELTPAVAAKPVHLFRVLDTTIWRPVSGQSIWGDRKIMSPNPANGAAVSYHVNEEFSGSLKIEIRDTKDKVVRTLQTTAKPGLHTVYWDLRVAAAGGRGGRRGGQSRSAAGPAAPVATYTATLRAGNDVQQSKFQLLEDPILKP